MFTHFFLFIIFKSSFRLIKILQELTFFKLSEMSPGRESNGATLYEIVCPLPLEKTALNTGRHNSLRHPNNRLGDIV